MKIKEQAINALKNMNSSEVMIVYDLILSLKSGIVPSTTKDIVYKDREKIKPYIKVRNALRSIRDSLSKDISIERNDRI